MPGPVQAPQTRYISLDTDFGYDALGGMGRLGRHSMEVLEPGTRQTGRIPGPPRTVGRWFAKLLDSLTPASWRAQGKFRRGLEDFSAQTGRILGHLRNAAAGAPDDPRRREDLEAALRELAGLRRTARPMTSRGTDYAGLLQTRVRRNMAILREEDPQRAQELRQLQASGLLDAVIADLDAGQADMAADLALIRDALHTGADDMAARVEARATDLGTAPAAPLDVTAPPTAPQPYRSRFSPAALRDFFLGRFDFKAEARQALQERQATLARFTGEARDTLQAALEAVDAVLQDRLAADADSFAHVQHQVDEKMRRAIRCALDDVCALALRHLDTPESVGEEGQDFRRIDADFVRQELAALERGQRPATGDSAPADAAIPDADPFRQGIRQARRQIRDISRLYGQLTEGLDELAQRDSRCRACLLLHGLAETDLPPDMDRQEWGRACDTLIEALRSPATDAWAVRDALSVLDRRTGDDRMPEDVRQRFQEGRAGLLRHLEPAMDRPVFQLAGTGQAQRRLDALEQARALHQVVGHAGALLQRARLPQADSLISQGLQISRLALRLRTAGPREPEHRQQAVTELRTSVARFMANLTLARMQTENPTVHSAQPEARGLDTSGAREGLDLMRQSVERICGTACGCWKRAGTRPWPAAGSLTTPSTRKRMWRNSWPSAWNPAGTMPPWPCTACWKATAGPGASTARQRPPSTRSWRPCALCRKAGDRAGCCASSPTACPEPSPRTMSTWASTAASTCSSIPTDRALAAAGSSRAPAGSPCRRRTSSGRASPPAYTAWISCWTPGTTAPSSIRSSTSC